jgi:hypothetical protein
LWDLGRVAVVEYYLKWAEGNNLVLLIKQSKGGFQLIKLGLLTKLWYLRGRNARRLEHDNLGAL